MADSVTPLTTEHLRIMREDIATLRAEVKEGFTEVSRRLGRVEQGVLGLKRDEVETATELAEHRHTLDKVKLADAEQRRALAEMREMIDQVRNRLDAIEARSPG